MSNMSAKRLGESVFIIVSDSKLLARFTHDGSYRWIINLTYSREEVMCGLMVESP